MDDETLNPELYREQECDPEPAGCDNPPFVRHFIIGMWIFAGLWCIGFPLGIMIAAGYIR